MISLINFSLILPALTTLIGAGGFTVGIYSFLNPTATARIYGIPVPTNSSPISTIPDLTTFLQESPSESESKTSQTSTPSRQPLDNHHSALLHSLAIRNLTTGLTILILTALYALSITETDINDPVNVLMRQILGIVILIGAWVPIIDANFCWEMTGEVGMRAGFLHFARAVLWVGVGIYCLWHGVGWGGRQMEREEEVMEATNDAVKNVVKDAVRDAVKECFKMA